MLGCSIVLAMCLQVHVLLGRVPSKLLWARITQRLCAIFYGSSSLNLPKTCRGTTFALLWTRSPYFRFRTFSVRTQIPFLSFGNNVKLAVVTGTGQGSASSLWVPEVLCSGVILTLWPPDSKVCYMCITYSILRHIWRRASELHRIVTYSLWRALYTNRLNLWTVL